MTDPKSDGSVDSASLEIERLKIVVDVWKYIVSVQMHFNDMEMKVRNLYFTILAAAMALMGVVQGRRVRIFYPETRISLVLFVIVALIPITWLFYFIDRHWYHRLLQGAVAQGVEIESKYETALPEIQLGSKIRDLSPVTLEPIWLWKWLLWFVRDPRFRKHGRLHSDQKIEVVYLGTIIALIAGAVLYALFNGVEVSGCTLTSYVARRHCMVEKASINTVHELIYAPQIWHRDGS